MVSLSHIALVVGVLPGEVVRRTELLLGPGIDFERVAGFAQVDAVGAADS